MKKLIGKCLSFIFLCFSISLHGTKEIECADSIHHFLQSNLGIDFNYARYKLGELSDIGGYLAGIHFDFYFKKPSSAFVGLYFDGKWKAGPLCSDINCCHLYDLRSDIKDYITSFHLGYNAATGDEKFMFTPFSGIGFYFLSNTLAPDIIRYEYFNFYVPLGMEFQWNVKDHFHVGLNATYRLDAHTRVKVSTPCVDICEKLDIKRCHGFKVEIPLTWKHTFCKRVDFQTKVSPFFDWNKFGASKENTCFCIPIQVPEMKQWYVGLSVLLGIRF